MDPDQDQQPCGDSFQVLQGVRISQRTLFIYFLFIVSASFTAETVLLLQFCVVTWSTVSKQPILTRKNVLNKKAKAEEHQKLVVCKKTLELTFQFLTDDDESRLLSCNLL